MNEQHEQPSRDYLDALELLHGAVRAFFRHELDKEKSNEARAAMRQQMRRVTDMQQSGEADSNAAQLTPTCLLRWAEVRLRHEDPFGRQPILLQWFGAMDASGKPTCGEWRHVPMETP